jgi:multidrug efflux pump subunit AcrA (membrane-fusion protein)
MTLKVRFALFAFVVFAGCSKAPEEKEKTPVSVQVTAVTQATIRRIVQGEGALFPLEQAGIMPKISSPVRRFLVNRGDHVKQGQLLAVLENRDLISAAAESQGALEQAQANFRTTQVSTVPDSVVKAQTDMEAARDSSEGARKLLESRQQLFKEGALAGRLVDEAQLSFSQANAQYRAAQAHLKTLESVRQDEIDVAAAQVKSAKAHVESQEAQVGYSRVESPISGIVSDRALNAGETANAGSPLITIVNISRVIARVDVPQSEVSAVKIGQTATLTQSDTKDEVEGKVTVVTPVTDPNTTTVQVWIDVPNRDERLKPGTAIHAAIATEVFKAATVVPAAAILPGEEGGTSVFTISADSVAHRRAVTLGVRQGNQVQILNGLNPGEEFVVVGGMGLDDNTKVKIVTTAVEESDDDEEDTAAEPDPAPNSKNTGKKDGAAKK